MVDIPAARASLPPQQSTAAAPGLTPVAASPATLPDRLQQLLRQVQVTATVAVPPSGGTLVLNTALGQMTLLLPQLMDDKKSQLLQQLMNVFQTQKPITITIQPGNPPTETILLLPFSAPAPTETVSANVAAQVARIPVVPGAALPAVVLPPSIVLPTTLSPQTVQPQTTPQITLPQAYTSFAGLPAVAPLNEAAAAAPSPFTPLTPTLPLVPEIDIPPTPASTILPEELAVQTFLNSGPMAFPATPPEVPSVPFPALQIPADQSLVLETPSLQAPSAPAISVEFSSPSVPTVQPQPNVPSTLTTATGSPILPQAPTPSLSLTLPSPPVSALSSTQENSNVIAAPAAQLTQILQPGSEAVVHVIAVSTPSQPQPVPQAPNQIVATVVASGPNGEPILKAGDTLFYVRQSEPLPAGSTLLVTITPQRPLPAMPILAPDMHILLNLQQIIGTIAQVDPQLAQQVMNVSIPQLNAALPATLLFLMSAFKQGSVRNWLGDDAIDTLTRSGKMDLIAHLAQNLDPDLQPTRDTQVGDWHTYPVPFYNQGQFQILNFHVHSDGRKSAEKDLSGKSRPAYIRFLIDMRLSRLGPMQFDGLVRPKQLDLIIRSEHTLPEGLHRDLRGLYARTLGVIDYMGSLNFQVGRQAWLQVQKSPSKAVVT